MKDPDAVFESLMEYEVIDEDKLFNKSQLKHQLETKGKGKLKRRAISKLQDSNLFRKIFTRNLAEARKLAHKKKVIERRKTGIRFLRRTPLQERLKLPKYRLQVFDFSPQEIKLIKQGAIPVK